MTLEATLTRIADALERIADGGTLTLVPPSPQTISEIYEAFCASREIADTVVPDPATLAEVKAELAAAQVQAPAETTKKGGRPRKPAAEAPVETPAVEPTPDPAEPGHPVEPAPTTAPSYDDITKEVTKLAALGGREAVLEVFKALGNINRLQDLHESRYAEARLLFIAAIAESNALLNDEIPY